MYYSDDEVLARQLQEEELRQTTGATSVIAVPRDGRSPTTASDPTDSGGVVVVASSGAKRSQSPTPLLDLVGPVPDIIDMFRQFNALFFQGKLDCVAVKWSPRMTLYVGDLSRPSVPGFVLQEPFTHRGAWMDAGA